MAKTHAGVDYADFYEREFHSVLRAVQPWVGAAAEDITQEAFVAALGQWSTDSHLGLDRSVPRVGPDALRRIGSSVTNRAPRVSKKETGRVPAPPTAKGNSS